MTEPLTHKIIFLISFTFRSFLSQGGGFGKESRRIAAQKILNGTQIGSITSDVLFTILNHKDVLADTVFQAIINVEKGIWNISQPDL